MNPKRRILTTVFVTLAVLTCVASAPAEEAMEKRKLFLYDDIALYPWSGWMGEKNGTSIALNLYDEETFYNGKYGVQISTSGDESWCGIAVQCKANQWSPPGADFSGMVSITFSVKGQDGTENVRFEFMDKKYSTTMTLSDQWQQVTVPFVDTNDFTSVESLFAFVVDNSQNITFYLDEIYFEVYRPLTSKTSSIPKLVKGVGYNSIDSSKYSLDFDMIKHTMHANSLRFWGATDLTFNTLDKMVEYDLTAFLPYWMPRGGDDGMKADYRDETLRLALKCSVMNYLRFYLPHTAIIGVSLGNEVFKNLTPNIDENKIAFAQFLNDICNEIHNVYPNLKLTYAAEGSEPLDFLMSYTPSLDIYGSNAYGNIGNVIQDYQNHNYGKPLIFLEYGCFGWWEKPWPEYSDEERAKDYMEHWAMLKKASMGGYAFTWLDKCEDIYCGWGIVNNDRTPRPVFSALARAYFPGMPWLPLLLNN